MFSLSMRKGHPNYEKKHILTKTKEVRNCIFSNFRGLISFIPSTFPPVPKKEKNAVADFLVFTQSCTPLIIVLHQWMTAEMLADEKGNQECARLVREYLKNEDEEERDEDTEIDNLTLTEVAMRIEEFNVNEPLMKTRMEDEQKKELEKIETECEREREKLETKFKRKRDATIEKHKVENKKFCAENEKTKKTLHQQLEKRLAISAGGAPGPSTPYPLSSPASLLPSETMNSLLQILTCGNGHLFCSSCNTGTTPGTPKQSKVVGIQSLGANTVTIKEHQLIVKGPDHGAATAIARQLSTGQAKLGNVGGKQVLLIIAPEEQAPPPPSSEPPKEPTTPPRESTPPPPPITVTAQLMQTPQGLKIELKGLQGVQLEQQQFVTIQQQVKQQLLKQQALARQQGKVPPTKVSLQLAGNIAMKKVEQPPNEAVTSTAQDTNDGLVGGTISLKVNFQ